MPIRILILLLFLFRLQVSAMAGDFAPVSGPCQLEFPRDHASHPDHRVEWWYYTGNLRSEEGAHFGFQLTFFRIGMSPPSAEKHPSNRSSAWRAGHVLAAHAALSDISSGVFLHSEQVSRSALDLAGTREEGDRFEVFVRDWSAEIAEGRHRLAAGTPDFSFSLDLIPKKRPVPHGVSGYSKKGEGAEEASCYYSITRFEASGKVLINGRERPVRGTAWMDHEFSSAPINAKLSGWDWFSLQLSDGSDLMIYLMREKSGDYSSISSGTFVDGEGKPVHLSSRDFRIQTLGSWKSGKSGAMYPASWLLEIPLLDLRINIVPNIADQELQTPGSTRITYWEGSVRAEGTGKGLRPLTAEGYAELTGYAGPVGF